MIPGGPDPTAPAQLHIGDHAIPLPMPEAGGPGAILFPGADIWIDGASRDWLAVAVSTLVLSQVREADERHDRHPRWGDVA